MNPRTLPSASQDAPGAPLAGLAELHMLHARRVAHAGTIAERVGRLVNSGLSHPDRAAVARRPPRRWHRFRWPVSVAA